MNTSFAYNSTNVNYGVVPGQPAEHRRGRRSPRIRPNRESARGLPVRLPHGRQRHRQHLREREVAVQDERSVQLPFAINVSAFYNARQGYPQEISVQSPPAPRRTTGCRGNGSGQIDVLLDPVGETPPAELPEPRLPRRAAGPHPERAVHPVAGRLQRRQQRHHPGDSQPPERGERQPDPGDRGAARAALRRPGELVRD